MKVVTKEERAAHESAIYWGGLKGGLIGSAMSLGLYGLCKYRYPKVLKLGTSAKTAIFITPPAFMASLFGELGSNNFDHDMYSSDYSQKETIEAHRRWAAMSTKDKVVSTLNENKYKVITGLWALSLWGSWAYVDRDKLLTKSQKFYEARMYAQFVTIILLLGSIGLSMSDENNEKAGRKLSQDDQMLTDIMNKVPSKE